jgi:signal transduction histidine kinase
VTVTVGPLGDGFYVADDGPGFTEENREHAFEHGFTTSEDGTGFGLSIVETICRAHGWDIRLDGAEGGARFEVTGIGPAEHSYPLAEDLSPRRSDGTSD